MPLFDDLATPQVHEKRLARHFGEKLRYEGDGLVFDAPLVCLGFSNRCGSNLLAGHLRSTPCFRGFHEQLNYDTVLKTCAAQGLDSFPDYIAHLCQTHIADGRLFGIKTSWDQLMMLHRCRIDRMFRSVMVVQMKRDDVVGQAISLMIADQTKQWTSAQRPLNDVTAVYRPNLLKSLVEAALTSEQMIRTICDTYALPRVLVTYETVVEDPGKAVRLIADFTGADLGKWSPRTPHISRQATSENAAFRREFMKDMSAYLRG